MLPEKSRFPSPSVASSDKPLFPIPARLRAGFGGCLSIAALLFLTQAAVGPTAAGPVLGSMGASAVLLFAVPNGPLSSHRAVFLGHLVSAAIGVACAGLIREVPLAAALAVGLSIFAMDALRCTHPPGGATALTAVLGGAEIRELGALFLVTPVLLNVLVMLTVARLFHMKRSSRTLSLLRLRRAPASTA